MRFTETAIPGAYVVELEPHRDDRGFFGRAYCEREFQEHGLTTPFVQVNVGASARRGTLRGLHFQASPSEEAKLVRCARGAAFDVVVDLRPTSPAYCRWFALELTPENLVQLYVPEGCAHGYLTLADDTEVVYQTTAFYDPSAERGAHYADPAFGIAWPLEVAVVSEKDLGWPWLGVAGEGER
jgi:dTDP-4-dehydrorhamnose 3,5-epimerase